MTTVACDGFWIAADGLVTTESGMIVEFEAAKLARLKDGSIIGGSGVYHAIDPLRAFLEGDKAEVEVCGGEWDAIRLMPDGTGLFYCDRHPTLGVPCSWPAVLGSGGSIALGAMLAGKTPKEAVEIAASRDVETGGAIVCLRIERD
jgi:ATP-dependent protease HslVU (ClpYQ) peptidase subunit